MRDRQIPLSERISRVNQGLAASDLALKSVIKRSAALALKDFFLDPVEYTKFMDTARAAIQKPGFREPGTYLDAVRLLIYCLLSADKPLKKLGNKMLEYVSTNYIDMFVVLRRINDDSYRESMHDVVKKTSISPMPLDERLRNMPSGKLEKFPVLFLSTKQLYQGVSVLTGSSEPDDFYREMVLLFVSRRTLAENNRLKDRVADLAYSGGRRWICEEDEDLRDDYAPYEAYFCYSGVKDYNKNMQVADCILSRVMNENNRLFFYMTIIPYVLCFGDEYDAPI